MIIRGTTPTVKYTFRTVNPEDISKAILCLTQGSVKIVRDKTTMVLEPEPDDPPTGWRPSYVLWTFTEEETLQLRPGLAAEIQMKYIANGLKYSTKPETEQVKKLLYEGWELPAESTSGDDSSGSSDSGWHNNPGEPGGQPGDITTPPDAETTPIGGEQG